MMASRHPTFCVLRFYFVDICFIITPRGNFDVRAFVAAALHLVIPGGDFGECTK